MDFERLINPKVCAIIGVSNDPLRASYQFLEAWLAHKYKGKIYLINPKYTEIQGIKTYPDIREIPDQDAVDYVLLVLPAEKVPAEISKCVEKGVKFVTIFSSGFSEIGNKQLEEEILKSAAGKLRVLGPNCIGVYSTESRLGYFLDQPIVTEGDVSFISQSGGITRKFIWTGLSRGFDIRATVSLGNTIDISISELTEWFSKDPKTQIIAAYIESIKEGHEFFSLLKTITPQKPVVILKCGRSSRGKLAAQSHTGALASSFEIFDSMAKQAGSLVVETLEQLTDLILSLEHLKNRLPSGNNVAIITMGGGRAVEITDTCESNGFNVVNLEDSTLNQLRNLLPSINVILENPIDLGTKGFNPEIFGKAFKSISQDPNIDIILTVHEVERFSVIANRFHIADIGEVYADLMHQFGNPTKPIISIIPRSWELVDHFITYQNYRNDLLNVGIPSYPTAQRALITLKKLLQYQNFLKTH